MVSRSTGDMERLLSKGAVQTVMDGGEVTNPVFQILGFKKISGQGGADRYRLNISDGEYCHTFAILATQYNDWIPDGRIDNYAVIRCNRVMSNTVNTDKKVIIILDLTVLHQGRDVARKLGKPQQWNVADPPPPAPRANGNAPRSAQQPYPTANLAAQPKAAAPYNQPAAAGRPPAAAPAPNFALSGSDFTGHVIPIRDITPYNFNKVAIKARITKKGPIRSFSNAKGEGKVFNMDLLDDSGEIRMSGFTQAVDTYYGMLEENQVYYFKNFTVKTANRQFSALDNDYEIQFTAETQVSPCLEDAQDIPMVTYSFTEIAAIEQAEANTFVDVIGVCTHVGDLVAFTSRASGKEFTKRDIMLLDKSNREISLTLWDKVAEEFSDESHPVVAAKRVKVSDFNGKSLSLPGSSLFQVNPDIPQAHFLRGWYDQEGSKLQATSLSGVRGADGGRGATPWKLLREATSAADLLGDRADYFLSKVMIMSFKRDSVLYKACAVLDCKKKIVDSGNGQYRCEKCQRDFVEFRWRVMLQVDFADCSDHLWATCFQEVGEQILGHDSDELGKMYSERPDEFDALLKEALFRAYIVKFKAKMESFNGENRLKTTVMELHPIKASEYARQLLAEAREADDF